MKESKDKINRVLSIYTKLLSGFIVNKAEEATSYGVNERSIQRDIDDIRIFLESEADRTGIINEIIYDRHDKGYRLEQVCHSKLSNNESLALCKILLDSRAFTKQEMNSLLDKLIAGCVPKENQKVVNELVCNEAFHYIEPRHKSQFLDVMWDIGLSIPNKQYINFEYFRVGDKSTVHRRVKPAAIMFSEYYFYLAAFIDDAEIRKTRFEIADDTYPTIYRLDRIKNLVVEDERFHTPYRSRFEEGEFRKRVQFMYDGTLQRLKFKYTGSDIDAILDRLPTAKILAEENGIYILSAEVFGKGIYMWLRNQGDWVELL